ncbi:hypothetical protein E5Q_00333, partial [Mixia osmundae IAM 14324]
MIGTSFVMLAIAASASAAPQFYGSFLPTETYGSGSTGIGGYGAGYGGFSLPSEYSWLIVEAGSSYGLADGYASGTGALYNNAYNNLGYGQAINNNAYGNLNQGSNAYGTGSAYGNGFGSVSGGQSSNSDVGGFAKNNDKSSTTVSTSSSSDASGDLHQSQGSKASGSAKYGGSSGES